MALVVKAVTLASAYTHASTSYMREEAFWRVPSANSAGSMRHDANGAKHAALRAVLVSGQGIQEKGLACFSMRRLDDPMVSFGRGRKGRRRLRNLQTVVCRLLDPVEFDPEKLKVTFVDALNPADVGHPEQLIPRHYTLTHNDVTAELHLTIGSSFNSRQLVGWYTRLLRDDVKAEWKIHGSEPGHLALHVHCHVSGGHPLMAPAALRNWIFEREMPLVLQAFRHGDRELLAMHPELDMATVWIHYHSCDSKYNRADCWGPLCLAANSLRSPMLGSLRVDYAKSLDDVEQVLPLSALYWHAEKSIQPSKVEITSSS